MQKLSNTYLQQGSKCEFKKYIIQKIKKKLQYDVNYRSLKFM